MLPAKLDRAIVQQPPQHGDVLEEVGQRLAIVHAEYARHARPVAWSDAEAQAPRGELRDGLRLLHGDDGVARPRRHDRRPQQDGIRLYRRGGKEGECIEACAAGREPRSAQPDLLEMCDRVANVVRVAAHGRDAEHVVRHSASASAVQSIAV